MPSSTLIQIIQFAINAGAPIVGKIAALAHLLHPDHALTNDEIDALEEAAQADNDRRIAARTPG